MDKLNEAIQKITPPPTDIILQGAYEKMQNRPSIAKAIAYKFAKAAVITAAAMGILLVAFFVPRMVERPIPANEGGLFPISGDFVLDAEGLNIQGFLMVSNGEINDTHHYPILRRTEDGRTIRDYPRRTRRYGLINMDGEIVVPIIYTMIPPVFAEGFTLATREDEGGITHVFLDREGNQLDFAFGRRPDDFSTHINQLFMDGLTTISVNNFNDNIFESFVVNRNSEIVFREEGVFIQHLGYGLLRKSDTSPFIRAWDDERERHAWVEDFYGNVIFDKDLTILPLHADVHVGTTTTFYTSRGWGIPFAWGIFCTLTHELVTDMEFSWISGFFNDRAIVRRTNNDIFIIDERGNNIKNLTHLFYPYEINVMPLASLLGNVTAIHFVCGKSPVIINTDGEILAETDFDSICMFNAQGVAVFSYDGLYGYVNSFGEVILPAEFCFVSMMYEGVGFVRKNDRQYRFVKN